MIVGIKVSTISDGIHWNYHKYVLEEETSHQHEIFTVSKVSSHLYCNRHGNSGTEPDSAKLFLYGNLWQIQTVKNSVLWLFGANDKQLWIIYLATVTNGSCWCCSQINLIKGLIFELSALHDYGYSQT